MTNLALTVILLEVAFVAGVLVWIVKYADVKKAPPPEDTGRTPGPPRSGWL